MNRERQLAQAFVALSDTYAAEFDPLHLFHRLVHSCRELLDADAAAVMIGDARGSLKTMATTDDHAAFIELLQVQTGQGPCMDCYRTAQAVAVPDSTAEYERWPKLVTAMLEAGYGSLNAVPMRLHDRPLGTLTLLRSHAGGLPEDDVLLAQALADSATLALMHWSTEPARSDDVITRVQSVISAKATLEIAKGMIAQQAGTTLPEAARLLSGYASHHRLRLTETAHALVTRALEPAAVVDGQPPAVVRRG
ncbi:GAF and ANTAR domain-containing protein [Streptomyces sp. NPDC048191]|uniref:GAF and ANTAR domain-containing protein n=1 Tax=Streptomyces sp. NPDC048191 TaxID=3155484 RepID=UPI0033DA36EA